MQSGMSNRRPCYVHCQNEYEERGLFHCWMNDGDEIMAIVEFEDGTNATVPIERIKFANGGFDEFKWE